MFLVALYWCLCIWRISHLFQSLQTGFDRKRQPISPARDFGSLSNLLLWNACSTPLPPFWGRILRIVHLLQILQSSTWCWELPSLYPQAVLECWEVRCKLHFSLSLLMEKTQDWESSHYYTELSPCWDPHQLLRSTSILLECFLYWTGVNDVILMSTMMRKVFKTILRQISASVQHMRPPFSNH